MSVLVEAISVVVRRDRIAGAFRGGWAAFVRLVPNPTLCYDDNVARVGFMDFSDVTAFIESLEAKGLRAVRGGKAHDLVVIDQLQGPSMVCDWIETAAIDLPGEGKVIAARMTGDEASPFVAPGDWAYGQSLSAPSTCLTTPDLKKLEFLRHESGLDVYRDSRGGEVYVGRTTAEGGAAQTLAAAATTPSTPRRTRRLTKSR